ncbi:hypothetical protein [uncultured Desulfosarcina sp.]|uniref:hypothetical protein n=1 Tax=uncultured Desulfosarcina sp. TaxID=218289 RepID=UPI0029C7006E|nr:hypothetical protein [uncultured Desulfosarcina sp.]
MAIYGWTLSIFLIVYVESVKQNLKNRWKRQKNFKKEMEKEICLTIKLKLIMGSHARAWEPDIDSLAEGYQTCHSRDGPISTSKKTVSIEGGFFVGAASSRDDFRTNRGWKPLQRIHHLSFGCVAMDGLIKLFTSPSF